jgi:hypothetical protein
MIILPKAIYMFNVIPIKIPMSFTKEIGQSNLRFIWKHKIPQIAKATLRIKINAEGVKKPDFKHYYRAIEIKQPGRIPRWRLEVGSRKRPSYSEILERRWRHTLQA